MVVSFSELTASSRQWHTLLASNESDDIITSLCNSDRAQEILLSVLSLCSTNHNVSEVTNVETIVGYNRILQLLFGTAGFYVFDGDCISWLCDVHEMASLLCVVKFLLELSESFVTLWGAFAKLRKATINFVVSVPVPFAWNNPAPSGPIFIKFDVLAFFLELCWGNLSPIELWLDWHVLYMKTYIRLW
jgi:hypothetical protein